MRLDHILQGNVTLLVSAKPLWKQGEYENVKSPLVISSKVHACRLQMEFKVFNLEVSYARELTWKCLIITVCKGLCSYSFF